jgi:hypothetical protein
MPTFIKLSITTIPEFYGGGLAEGRSEYKDPDQSYLVFETEKTDKQGLYRWSLEVNAILSALPR